MPEGDRWQAVERKILLRELKTLRDKWKRDRNLLAVVDLEHMIHEVCGASLDVMTMPIEKSSNAGS